MTEERQIIACRSEEIIGELHADIEVIGVKGFTTLRAGGKEADDITQRRELITSVRGGAHAELMVHATTFRQKDGNPNRRFLRHNPERLPALATSYKGMPMLLDHATWSQRSRVGTISSSELAMHGGTGWASFRMGLHVVKPDAVISVLDGTLDRFSIGWNRGAGDVFCTVHKASVTGAGSCNCWPGDVVQVDGKPQIVEYEFQSAEGSEVSAVNVPAVKGTKIEDVRAALATELNLEIHRKEPQHMQFTRLAALLGLAALGAADEDRACTIVEGLRRDALAAGIERDKFKTELADEKSAHDVTRKSVGKAAIDGVLDGAYRDGRLVHGRDSEGKATPSVFEPQLRKLGEQPGGLELLRTEIATYPVRVPVRRNELDGKGEPARNVGPDELTDDEKIAASELGLDEKDYLETKRSMRGGK